VTNVEILESAELIKTLEKNGFNNSSVKKAITSHKYGFLITTEHENDEDKKEQVNSSFEKKSMLNFLFEALKTNTAKIQESLIYAINNALDEIKKLPQFKDIEFEQYKDLFYL
jgi:molecular chaperone DnaK (HSP70)